MINLKFLAAKSADEPCYDHNQKGVEYGNCGTDRNGNFVACNEDNIKCGTLYCKDGDTIPKKASLTSFNLQFVHEKSQQLMQCKYGILNLNKFSNLIF